MTQPAKPAPDPAPDTACRKCKTPMQPPPPPDAKVKAMFGSNFTVTGYRCAKCGHWNSLKRRKPAKPAKPQP